MSFSRFSVLLHFTGDPRCVSRSQLRFWGQIQPGSAVRSQGQQSCVPDADFPTAQYMSGLNRAIRGLAHHTNLEFEEKKRIILSFPCRSQFDRRSVWIIASTVIRSRNAMQNSGNLASCMSFSFPRVVLPAINRSVLGINNLGSCAGKIMVLAYIHDGPNRATYQHITLTGPLSPSEEKTFFFFNFCIQAAGRRASPY